MLEDDILFCPRLDGAILRSFTKNESLGTMKEALKGPCREHQGGRCLYQLFLRVGYYWPWGLNFIGPISPLSSEGHKFVLTSVEYFTKLAKAIPVKRQTGVCDTIY